MEKEELTKETMAFPLLEWFDENKRVLPWREDPKPYRVWISEIMLQQTRVETVKSYFERFMNHFPTILDLAEAEEDELLKAWEGLGYYSRAKNLQKAAKILVEQYDAKLPMEQEELLKIPGIGPYTSGAISSIAYGRKAAAVDGNVLRVFMRLLADDSDILKESVKKKTAERVLALMPEERAGDFNQALMELGAMVCLPHGAPKCKECPLMERCAARKQGREEEFPKKSKNKLRKRVKRTILILSYQNQIVLQKRPDTGLLSGLYEFPGLEGIYTKEDIGIYLEQMGVRAEKIKKIERARHIFSHVEWYMQGYYVEISKLTENKVHENMPWIFVERKTAREQYPIPSAFLAYKKYL